MVGTVMMAMRPMRLSRPRSVIELMDRSILTVALGVGKSTASKIRWRCIGTLLSEHTDTVNYYLNSWTGSGSSNKHIHKGNTSSNRSSFSSSSRTKSWIGINHIPTKHHELCSSSRSSSSSSPLTVSGASYLLPTLRLERGETAASLSTRLQSFLRGGAGGGTAAIRAMLHPKEFAAAPERKSEDSNALPSPRLQRRLTAPVVLDARAFQHDGSPHYVSPPAGSLAALVGVLGEWGIEVIGLTNVSRTRAGTSTANTTVAANGQEGAEEGTVWEREAAELGLPVLVARVGRTLGGTGGKLGRGAGDGAGEVLRLEDVVRLLIAREVYEDGIEVDGGGSIKSSSGEEELALSKEVPAVEEGDTAATIQGVKEDNITAYHINAAPIETIPTPPAPPLPTLPPDTKIFHGSVRSGQQVSTDRPNQSLVVVGNVNSGGEVMAEGDLYVFGRLKGRALAGLAFMSKSNKDTSTKGAGDTTENAKASSTSTGGARIFATVFDPELVCIGESFTTVDSVEELGLLTKEGGGGTGAMVRVDDEGELVFVGF